MFKEKLVLQWTPDTGGVCGASEWRATLEACGAGSLK